MSVSLILGALWKYRATIADVAPRVMRVVNAGRQDGWTAALSRIAVELGTAATPEAIARHAEQDPEGFKKALIVADESLEEFEAELELAEGAVAAGNERARDEQKSDNPLARYWRPIFGFTFTGIYGWLGVTVIAPIMLDGVTATDAASFSTFITTGAGVLGYYVHSRTKEKKARISQDAL